MLTLSAVFFSLLDVGFDVFFCLQLIWFWISFVFIHLLYYVIKNSCFAHFISNLFDFVKVICIEMIQIMLHQLVINIITVVVNASNLVLDSVNSIFVDKLVVFMEVLLFKTCYFSFVGLFRFSGLYLSQLNPQLLFLINKHICLIVVFLVHNGLYFGRVNDFKRGGVNSDCRMRFH